ncbi:MAG: prolipoprotein diacylglyceryl transferase [Cytophagaceae bacterium]|nr:prolipoprotein diacylglyceryl transferase [Cytophagaceae bacterium]MDW8456619.1 prolipoprotein diacylglyceryl transferase [Cytophagaceae bacterium]
MKKIWNTLKQRWGIKSDMQVVLIFIVFAITGMTTVQIRKPVFDLIGVNEQTPQYMRIILWLITVFPLYYVFLLAYGFLFGQFDFFYGLVKKTFGRMFGKKKHTADKPVSSEKTKEMV